MYGRGETMQDTKMTVRVPREVLEEAKRYARAQGTTLTRLITLFLEQLSAENNALASAPIVRRLSGTLSPDVTEEDYRRHLDEKYGIQA
jgi:hypothetical protein